VGGHDVAGGSELAAAAEAAAKMVGAKLGAWELKWPAAALHVAYDTHNVLLAVTMPQKQALLHSLASTTTTRLLAKRSAWPCRPHNLVLSHHLGRGCIVTRMSKSSP